MTTDDPNLGPVVVSEEAIRDRTKELGARIAVDYAARPPLLVGVLKGAFVFMSDLARAIDLPVEFDFMAVASYGSSTRTSGVVRIVKDLDSDLTGRHVLVVEDIVDSGLTLAFLLRNLAARHPASLRSTSWHTWAFASRGTSWSATGSTLPSATATSVACAVTTARCRRAERVRTCR